MMGTKKKKNRLSIEYFFKLNYYKKKLLIYLLIFYRKQSHKNFKDQEWALCT